MGLLSKFRSLILAGSAIGLVAACSEADVVSPGAGNPINPIVIPPGSGGGGGGAFPQNNVPAGGCPAGTSQNNSVNLGDGVQRAFCVLSGTLAGNISLPALGSGRAYLLSGAVSVGTDGGTPATLTIAAGAVLFGANFDNAAASGSVDVLFVTRGSQIFANGTQTNPIIFTSQQDLLDDGLPNGTGGYSEWGGLALNGRAPINHCTTNPAAVGGSVDCTKNGEGGSGLFGGATSTDNSGSLSFVRIQHAGFQFTSTNELNSLALQGVGSGTNLDHIQVIRGGDDAFEFFGGAVNARYLVAGTYDDDGFDWTDGWSGNFQFGVLYQEAGHGDNGIEGDSRELTFDNLPISNPSISNVTLLGRGASSGEGVQVRAKTNGRLLNGVVANFSEGLEWNMQGTAPVPQPVINSFAFNGNVTNFAASGMTLFNAGASNRANASDTLIGVFPGPNETSTPATNPTSLGAFFTTANYVGAFGPGETATSNWTSGWTVGVPGASTVCPTGTTDTGMAVPAGRPESRICRLPATIIGNLNLTPGNLYQFGGATFVGQDRGADPANPLIGTQSGTLTIDAGVTVISDGKNNSFDILIVNRGSQIVANGSAAAPVVLTSTESLTGAPTSGDWGGLYINGRAPINHCTVNPAAVGGSVDCQKTGEAGSGVFGGATTADNSGVLNYVRIEYAGNQFTSTNEANSLTLQGVGNGTLVDYVNTYFGKDDGVEFFGGSVNAKHLVLVGAEDDSFDWTDGWNGKVQFVIVRQNPVFAVNDNGLEGDSRELTFDNLPLSNPTLSNFTLIGQGSASGEGVQVRAKTDGRLMNMIVTNFAEGLEYNPQGTAPIPVPVVRNSTFTANTTQFAASGMTLFTNGPGNFQAATSTLLPHPNATIALVPGANESAPNVVAIDPNGIDGFFTSTTYVGAVQNASDTWFAGWTRGL